MNAELDPLPRAPGPGAQAEARDRGDGREGLPPEAEGADPGQVVRVPELARGVALQGQAGVLGGHPGPVVAHGDELDPAPPHLHPHPTGPGVEGVLHQLLHDRGRPLHHLARGDLVHQGVGSLRTRPARSSRARALASTKSGRRSRSSGGYPHSASSGVTIRSAPAARARSEKSTMRSTLPGMSPTVAFICAIAIFMRWMISSGGLQGSWMHPSAFLSASASARRALAIVTPAAS